MEPELLNFPRPMSVIEAEAKRSLKILDCINCGAPVYYELEGNHCILCGFYNDGKFQGSFCKNNDN